MMKASISVLVSLGALGFPANAQSPPPFELYAYPEHNATFDFESGVMWFSYLAVKRKITVYWTVEGQLSGAGGASQTEQRMGREEFALRFWPTAIARIDDYRIAIGGKLPTNGDTVVEIHEFSPPQLIPIAGSSGTTGTNWAEVPVKRTGITQVMRTSSEDMVAAIFPRLDATPAEHLLVQFWGSKDLYSVDISSGQLTLEVSSTPEIAHDFDLFTAGNHVSDGYVYMMTREWKRNTNMDWVPGEVVLVVDSDRDGSIDSVTEWSNAQWYASDYTDAASWVDVH